MYPPAWINQYKKKEIFIHYKGLRHNVWTMEEDQAYDRHELYTKDVVSIMVGGSWLHLEMASIKQMSALIEFSKTRQAFKCFEFSPYSFRRIWYFQSLLGKSSIKE